MNSGNDIIVLSNTPKVYKVGNKDYLVKKLSILQVAIIREQIAKTIKKEIETGIMATIGMLPEKDRLAVLRDARNIIVSEEQINSSMMNESTIISVLSKVLNITADEAKGLLADNSNNQDVLWDIYGYALGFDIEPIVEKPEPIDNKVDTTGTANVNTETVEKK
jgi:hypothetical protein